MTEMTPIPHPALAGQDAAPAEAAPAATRSLSARLIARLRKLDPLFTGLVIVPTLLAALYFGAFASDVYVSESRFIVRSPTKPNLSPLGVVLSGGNIVGASEESAAVSEFLASRQALGTINQDGFVTRAWGNDTIFRLDRFGGLWSDTAEDLFEYYLGQVTAEDADKTMVTVLAVEAFDPQSAQTINRRLLEASEVLVNDLSTRARRDGIAFAEAELARARAAAQGAAIALAAYRDAKGVIDPELQANAGLQMIGKLQDQLIAAQTQLLQMETYTPRASQIPYLRTQIRKLEAEIGVQTAQLAGGRGSLSATSVRYQELRLASEYSEKQLAIALSAYQEAQAEARRKQAYVERIAQPSLPDDAAFPRRLRGVLATFVLGLLAWGVAAMLLIGVREHRE
jgi:ABC-2 type transport system permease protein/capsular polysaccharide transport system permease protein